MKTNNEKWQGNSSSKSNSGASRDGKSFEKRDVKSILKGSRGGAKFGAGSDSRSTGSSDYKKKDDSRPAYGDRKPFGNRDSKPTYGDRKPWENRAEKPAYGDRKPYESREGGRPSFGEKNRLKVVVLRLMAIKNRTKIEKIVLLEKKDPSKVVVTSLLMAIANLMKAVKVVVHLLALKNPGKTVKVEPQLASANLGETVKVVHLLVNVNLGKIVKVVHQVAIVNHGKTVVINQLMAIVNLLRNEMVLVLLLVLRNRGKVAIANQNLGKIVPTAMVKKFMEEFLMIHLMMIQDQKN